MHTLCSGCNDRHDPADCPVRAVTYSDDYCTLHRLGLCPDCAEAEERDAEQAAHDAWVDNQIKWEQEERLMGRE